MKKLLALNRSEIAIRILRAANELGLRTVAIYSQEDRLALHRFKADEAYLIGEGKGPVEAYLDVEGIVALARGKGRRCDPSGLRLSLRESGAAARLRARPASRSSAPARSCWNCWATRRRRGRLAQQAGIPVVPGTEEPVTQPQAGREDRRRNRLPADRQGGLRRRRTRHARGGESRPISRAAWRRRAAKPPRPSATTRCFWSASSAARATSRCRFWATGTATSLHLYERDCSVQRRHQKVVEVAPAVALDAGIRRALAEAAVALARAAGYYNAGTVEFLVDADSGEWYFIEVNPRIQVEHTVTEMVTGIDLVRCQIQVAQGLRAARRRDEPAARRSRFRSTATRCSAASPPRIRPTTSCRITASFHTYRSPAGFGIRLDGGSAYGGAVITPYYDSLLVKITAWGREFQHACQRMDRGLREFRVRGVKTNIPFLENVVNHADFQAGRVTTRWLEETPELFRFAARRDRATKLLTYLGEVIVNGNPAVAGKPAPARDRRAACPAARSLGAARRHAPAAAKAGPGGIRRVDCARRSGCCSPTPLSATRTSRCWPRACAPTTCWPSPTSSRTACTICSAWRCGAARPSTWPCASCTKIRWRACAGCAKPFPTSVSRCCCAPRTRWATRPIPTTWWRSSSTKPPRRASTSSASSIR